MANNEKVNKAFALYQEGRKLKDIAAELDVPEGTIRSWKNRYKWDNGERESVATKHKNVATQKRNVANERCNGTAIMEDAIKETFDNNELTPQQQVFCAHYIKTYNATQSYIKAFGCSYNVANAEGYKLLVNPCIAKELDRLKEIKRRQIEFEETDLVEYHMRIAFADIGDYLTFGSKDVGNGIKENVVTLNASDTVDTQLIQEVKQGKSGVTIKLADKHKSLEWLDKHFLYNPMDKHKQEYDRQKYELELLRLEMQVKDSDMAASDVEDNFMEALNAVAGEVWSDG
ncbi:MAG: terminase small subunit [Muribaculaceae bacterium]|nr:terminase small subunit [Muribaculaceae bacterium]MCM1399877.1 terminase small subunit [Clostridium sp.]MCM1460637.1 terminase small subunit [Bacteroides sp.]